MKFLTSVACIALAVVLIDYLLPGVTVTGLPAALGAGLVLAIAQKIVKPILIILTLPITIVTLGLFILVINGLFFYVAAMFVKGFTVTSFTSALLAAVVLSFMQTIFTRVIK
jgi:putative membrane protein